MADEEVRLEVKRNLESVYDGDPRKNLRVNHALQRLRCKTLPMVDIISDYNSGMSVKRIADWHGVSHSTIINSNRLPIYIVKYTNCSYFER